MPTMDFTGSELIEISDAISEVIRRRISENDKERDELKYGMLTLLYEAQAKILPVAFGFTHADTPWTAAQEAQIEAIRRQQGLPDKATVHERQGWRTIALG